VLYSFNLEVVKCVKQKFPEAEHVYVIHVSVARRIYYTAVQNNREVLLILAVFAETLLDKLMFDSHGTVHTTSLHKI
jgi:hypothetical protein